jgi:hypothetical protein
VDHHLCICTVKNSETGGRVGSQVQYVTLSMNRDFKFRSKFSLENSNLLFILVEKG